MTAVYKRNPNLEAELRASPDMKTTRRIVATEVAKVAEALVPSKYRYHAEVVEGVDTTFVEARTDTKAPGSLAGWLEFGGTKGRGNVPALHPLRRGAEDAGLEIGPDKK